MQLRLSALLGLSCLALALVGVEAQPAYIPTPAGLMRADCVHRVSSGSLLRENAEGRLEHHDAQGNFVRLIPRCANQHVHPLLQPRHQRHQRQQRQVLRDELDAQHVVPGQRLAVRDDPFPADYDGWLAYTAWQHEAGIDAFLGNFSVPDWPASAPDILYIFTGLQNVDWIPKRDPEVPVFDIIQPVLQYPADAGLYWSVKSWYVTTDEGAIASDEMEVVVGDVVFGNMTRTGNSTWFIGSTAVSTGESTTVSVERPRLSMQPWAYNVLECYGCIDCTTYPKAPSKFSELALFKEGQPLQPEWLLNPKPNPSLKCAETIDILSPEAQNIIFHK